MPQKLQKPNRSNVINFRLTAAEYKDLYNRAVAAGADSVSHYVRTRLFSAAADDANTLNITVHSSSDIAKVFEEIARSLSTSTTEGA